MPTKEVGKPTPGMDFITFFLNLSDGCIFIIKIFDYCSV